MKKTYAKIITFAILTIFLAACSSEAPETTIVVVPAGSDVTSEDEADTASVEDEAEVQAEEPTVPAGPQVQINSISLQQSTYIVEYETFGYTEAIPGMHIHFFFNSVAPQAAGVGGGGSWYVWGGPRPFDGYTTGEKGTASEICALVANSDHSIILNTGNCYALPDSPAG